jgi:photosynthetic reaction center H subunit
MDIGAFTPYMDVAQITLYAFWVFFAVLVYYLRSEDKREGYPLVTDGPNPDTIIGFPPLPEPKTFLKRDGSIQTAPRAEAPVAVTGAVPAYKFPGAPLIPTGNALLAGIGPASWANREDAPDLDADGHNRIVPLRADAKLSVAAEDVDPRGFEFLGSDDKVAGTVSDVWVDRGDLLIRYYEVTVRTGDGSRAVLIPGPLVSVDPEARKARSGAVPAALFAGAPALKSTDRITLREEDRTSAYFGGGYLLATPDRSESWL